MSGGFHLPRWTVYPALGVLAIFAVTAVPRPAGDRHAGFSLAARGEAPPPAAAASQGPPPPGVAHPRLVVLGIDGLDPEMLQETIALYPERMRHFAALVAEGGVHSLGTSTPPQSPVAWSNFITGLDPGGHGIYDFIHRDLVTRAPAPSTVKMEESDPIGLFGGWQIPFGGDAPSNRTGEAFWVTLARHGVPADIWRMPANFPVEPAQGLSFPGMMTPALDSAYGTYTLFSSEPPADTDRSGGVFRRVTFYDGATTTYVEGPPNAFKADGEHIRAPLRVYVDTESDCAAIELGSEVLVLRPGQWSDFVEAEFKALPGFFDFLTGYSTRVIGSLRFYLRSVQPVFELYASPVNIDPKAPAMPVSQPVEASAELAEAIGLYYTQGMAEEVNALKDEALTDEEFMQQVQLVYGERVRMLDYALDHYLEEQPGGLLFFYFSTVDLASHMMWRFHDVQHPQHTGRVADLAQRDSSSWTGRAGSQWKEVIHDLYMRMDPVLGHLRERLPEGARLVVMSDHGFATYTRKFSLNTWLLEEGYLVLKPGREREGAGGSPKTFIMDAVDWTRTRAYGMGFNGLYLNLAGRELDNPDTPEDESGIVQPGAEAEALLRELKLELEGVTDPATGKRVVLRADLATEVYHGARVPEAPDILVGYDAGYGNSDASSTGRIPHEVLADNLGGGFNGNHLMAPDVVPGTLLTDGRVRPGAHALEDLTVEILKHYGVAPLPGQRGHAVLE